MNPVRVTLIWNEREAETKDKVFIDLYLDEHKKCHEELTFLGWSTADNNPYPFLLFKDGKIDYGAGYETDEERFGLTNLRPRPIEIGEYANFTLGGEEYTYRIIKIDPLNKL
jgi:hypothetical protein